MDRTRVSPSVYLHINWNFKCESIRFPSLVSFIARVYTIPCPVLWNCLKTRTYHLAQIVFQIHNSLQIIRLSTPLTVCDICLIYCRCGLWLVSKIHGFIRFVGIPMEWTRWFSFTRYLFTVARDDNFFFPYTNVGHLHFGWRQFACTCLSLIKRIFRLCFWFFFLRRLRVYFSLYQ